MVRLCDLDHIQGAGGSSVSRKTTGLPTDLSLKYFIYICTQVSDKNGTSE